VSSKELSLATFFSSGKKGSRGSEGRGVLQRVLQTVDAAGSISIF